MLPRKLPQPVLVSECSRTMRKHKQNSSKRGKPIWSLRANRSRKSVVNTPWTTRACSVQTKGHMNSYLSIISLLVTMILVEHLSNSWHFSVWCILGVNRGAFTSSLAVNSLGSTGVRQEPIAQSTRLWMFSEVIGLKNQFDFCIWRRKCIGTNPKLKQSHLWNDAALKTYSIVSIVVWESMVYRTCSHHHDKVSPLVLTRMGISIN